MEEVPDNINIRLRIRGGDMESDQKEGVKRA